MKVLLGVFLVLSVSSVFCEEDAKQKLMDSIKNESLKKWLKHNDWMVKMEEKMEEMCPGSMTKMVPAMESMMKCFESTEDQTMCSIMRTSMMKCMEPMLKVVEECMSEDSKGMPTMMMKMMVSAMNFMCGKTGEEVMEMMNDCIYTKKSHDCMKPFESKIKEMMKQPPSVKGVCDMMKDLKPCWKQHVEASCKSAMAKKMFPDMLDAMMSPCNH